MTSWIRYRYICVWSILCGPVPAEEIENSFTWKGCIFNKEEYQRQSKPQFIFTLCLPECRDAPGRIFPNQRPDWGSMSVLAMLQQFCGGETVVRLRATDKAFPQNNRFNGSQ